MNILQRTKYHAAHQHSANHRKQVLGSEKCGCFYCLEIFSPAKIEEWVDEDENEIGRTALCPFCEIDSVIGSKSGVPITKEFLKAMNQVWF
jgi:hypothetical protein